MSAFFKQIATLAGAGVGRSAISVSHHGRGPETLCTDIFQRRKAAVLLRWLGRLEATTAS